MDATSVSEALVAWAAAVVAELADSTYSYPPVGKTKELPDVVGGVLREGELVTDPRFPMINLQQTGVRFFECQLSIMAEQGTAAGTPEEQDASAKAATDGLRSMVADLLAARRNDPSLDGRVFDTGAEVIADYEPGFVEYADGTRGREVRIVLTVGEPLEASR